MAGKPFSQVLVDTSVWIRFFRLASSPEARVLDALLARGPVATCAPIRAEVLSGTPNRKEFERLRTFFSLLITVDLPPDVWPRVEEVRFALARRGYQASVVDVMIAVTANHHRLTVWSLDEDFERISTSVPLMLVRAEELAS